MADPGPRPPGGSSRHVSRYQPPSGWATRPSNGITSAAFIGGGVMAQLRAPAPDRVERWRRRPGATVPAAPTPRGGPHDGPVRAQVRVDRRLAGAAQAHLRLLGGDGAGAQPAPDARAHRAGPA